MSHVECAVMDGQQLSLEDDSFDAAACSFGLMLFPDRARGFAELNRIIRPGGRVVVSGWAGPDRFELFGMFLDALNAALPDLPAPDAPPPVFSLADPDLFRAELEASGFQEVNVDCVARQFELANFEQLWEMLTTGAPPVQVLMERIGEQGQVRLRKQLEQTISERYGDEPIVTTNVATIGSGVVPPS